MYSITKWSDTLQKSCNICCQFLKFCLTILGCYSLKGESSVIRQKGESQNGFFKKTKHAKFSEKLIFLTPWYSHVRLRIRGKKCSFYGKFGVPCFLETPVLRFAILTYYRRIVFLLSSTCKGNQIGIDRFGGSFSLWKCI